jgi:hypothetical protein
MAYSRTRTLAWPPPQVFEAALAVASPLGFAVSQADRGGGHLYLDQPRRLGRFPRRYAVSVTDSGLGTTVVNITWQPASPFPWPSGGGGAARLHRGIHRTLGSGQPR